MDPIGYRTRYSIEDSTAYEDQNFFMYLKYDFEVDPLFKEKVENSCDYYFDRMSSLMSNNRPLAAHNILETLFRHADQQPNRSFETYMHNLIGTKGKPVLENYVNGFTWGAAYLSIASRVLAEHTTDPVKKNEYYEKARYEEARTEKTRKINELIETASKKGYVICYRTLTHAYSDK